MTMSSTGSFAAGLALGTVVAGSLAFVARNPSIIGWKVDSMCRRIEQTLHGQRVIHFGGSIDDVLLDHGRPVVEGDDPLFNAWR